MNYIFIIIIIAIFCSCSNHNNATGYKPTKEAIERERLADRIIAKVAAKLKQEKGLIPCGSGGGTSNGVRMLALSFFYRTPLTIESGRELLITSINELTNAVNGEERIRPYLKNYPFEPKNVEIGIFLQKPNGSNVSSELHVITAYDGILSYKIDDPNGPLFKTLFEETYEEAVQKINEQHNSRAAI